MTALQHAPPRRPRRERRRPTVHPDWRRDQCLSAATALLDQVMIIERHLDRAVDLLGDQPSSGHPAWTSVRIRYMVLPIRSEPGACLPHGSPEAASRRRSRYGSARS